MTPLGRPTLADVAARAGVSLKTASRAINGEYGVAPATAKRVQDAARGLGFRPNHLARALASRQTSAAVGLVMPDLSDPFLAALAAEVEKNLAARDLQFVSASHGDDHERQRRQSRALVERRVDALIVVPAPGDASYLQPDIDHGLVVVAVDRPLEGVSVDTVVVDNERAARLGVEGMIAAGHRRIAVLSFATHLWTTSERIKGYYHALEAAGITVDPSLVGVNCADVAEARAVARAMLEGPEPPTAVLAAKGGVGRAAIRAMLDAGVSLDLTVFDEVADPDLLVIPPSTVIGSDPVRLGASAASMVLERLDGLPGPAREVVMDPLFEHPRAPSTDGAAARRPRGGGRVAAAPRPVA